MMAKSFSVVNQINISYFHLFSNFVSGPDDIIFQWDNVVLVDTISPR